MSALTLDMVLLFGRVWKNLLYWKENHKNNLKVKTSVILWKFINNVCIFLVLSYCLVIFKSNYIDCQSVQKWIFHLTVNVSITNPQVVQGWGSSLWSQTGYKSYLQDTPNINTFKNELTSYLTHSVYHSYCLLLFVYVMRLSK